MAQNDMSPVDDPSQASLSRAGSGTFRRQQDDRRRSVVSDMADTPNVDVVGISTIAQMLEDHHQSTANQPRDEQQPRGQPGVATFTGVKQDKDKDNKPHSAGAKLAASSGEGTPVAPNGFFSAPLLEQELRENPFFSKSRRASDPDGSPEQRAEVIRPELPHKDDSASTIRGDLPDNASAEAPGSGLTDPARPPVGQPRDKPTAINYQDRPGQTTGEEQRFHQRVAHPTAHPPALKDQPPSQQPDIQHPQPRRAGGTSSTGNSSASVSSHKDQSVSHRGSSTNIELDEEGNQALVADYSGIVRLAEAGSMPSAGGTGDSGTGNSRGKSATSAASLPSGPTNARLAHQQRHSKASNSRATVQDFINEQAHTVNLLDPNAPTPSPTPHGPESAAIAESDGEAGNMDDSSERHWAERSETSMSVLDSSEIATAASVEDKEEASEPEEPIVTFRFEHVATNDGHHVVVGREGMLQRCEDEPITTPGAVQGFGVLVVLEEDMTDGNLIVRQVSENSTELIGLSPRYLFRLDCFTRVLTEEQEDILRDNIEYLPDTASGKGSVEEEGPQVFLLSGFGEPGSDDNEVDSQDSTEVGRRREWTCWVAAHRPKQPSWDKVDEKGHPVPPPDLIILEFELERDMYNPLMHVPESSSFSGGDTPESGSQTTASAGSHGPRSGSTGSGDPRSDGSLTTIASNPTPRPGVEQRGSDDSGTIIQGSGEKSSSDNTPLAGSSRSKIPSGMEPMGLEGLEVDVPLERIIESTTNHARPLRALERMRRTGMHGDTSSGSGSGTGPSRRSRNRPNRRRPPGSATGTMDVFAVLGQINEQLGSAPDLETFLKITVGVVQDLCRFHRVLIYQFDEAYNGQVVAELVEWGKTTDLFKGLMFPAADIPAQARQLYMINKVRLLYDRSQTTARMVLRSKEDLDYPLDMTHCYLRAMSPIHIKCALQGANQQLTDRPRQHARQVVHVGVDHGLWTALGFDRLSLVWSSWNASVIPSPTDDENFVRFDLEEH